MIEEQRGTFVNTAETADASTQQDTMVSPNEFVLARENLFHSFSWERWQELEATVIQSLSGFLLAAERKLPQMVVLHAISLQEAALELAKEAYLWVPPYPHNFREQLLARRKLWAAPQVWEDLPKDDEEDDDDDEGGLVRFSPFHNLRWRSWRKQQIAVIENLTNFLAAVEHKKPTYIMHAAVALQEAALEFQREAECWVLETP